jgi:hypothetical protein
MAYRQLQWAWGAGAQAMISAQNMQKLSYGRREQRRNFSQFVILKLFETQNLVGRG